MSLEAMDWVWNHSRSKGVGRMVMLALADKALPSATECKAYGSLTFLQGRANCTREAVTAALPVLHQLGELEVVEGEKGPYGASVYRLPKAIGHVRATYERRTNRSAHPTDTDSAIGRLARPGVVGSPDQSDGESVGPPDPNTTTSPKTTTSAPAAPSASSDIEGGGGGQQQEAERFLQSLPGPWAAGRATASKLAPLLLERIAQQGWDLNDALAAELTKNPGGISSFRAVLPGRIDDLAKKPTTRTRDSPTARPMPPWCQDEDCDEETRYRFTTVMDLPASGPCYCHPDHYQNGAA
ncbi:hypothetical protein [Streptacidiphilus cavernicola]|uniref:Helix-turn-helix domain-containing protein n=1 Tax=Streptacidiphilus cavernicola TaxID=3342716 RepID=A0ABV6VYC6_9ACTN